jgi:hypothetical protein
LVHNGSHGHRASFRPWTVRRMITRWPWPVTPAHPQG